MSNQTPNTALQPLVFRPREAAKLLNRSESWLAKKRCDGLGPRFIKQGQIFYQRSDLEDWLANQQRRASTAEYGGSHG